MDSTEIKEWQSISTRGLIRVKRLGLDMDGENFVSVLPVTEFSNPLKAMINISSILL